MIPTYLTTESKHEFSLATNGKNRKVFKYVFTLLVCILGLSVKLLLTRTIHYPEGGFLISLGTIMLSAWYGGFGPGLVAVILNYFIADWFFITPGKLFFNDSFVDQLRFIFFITEGILISWLFESLHKAHQKTRESLFIISQNEKLFRSLIDNVKDYAIFMVDARGHIQTWSTGATNMTGYQISDVLHKPLSILFPDNTNKVNTLVKSLQRASVKGQYKQEGWKLHKDKSLFWAETIFTALPGISANSQKFSIIIHDITSRKKTEELKNELLSIITHELRTPVAVMKVIIEQFLLNYSKKRDLKNEISDMADLNGEVDRLSLLVENILDIARLKTKKFSLQYYDIELSQLIEKVISKMQLIAGKNNTIVFRKTNNITISADQGKIEQVLMNLLDNAIKFTPKKGKIEVSVKVSKKMAIVSVLNQTNKKIPEDKYFLIFDKFYQLIKKPVKGLGLGLYISREIIKQHKGRLWVNSDADKGNIFSFSLPLK